MPNCATPTAGRHFSEKNPSRLTTDIPHILKITFRCLQSNRGVVSLNFLNTSRERIKSNACICKSELAQTLAVKQSMRFQSLTMMRENRKCENMKGDRINTKLHREKDKVTTGATKESSGTRL